MRSVSPYHLPGHDNRRFGLRDAARRLRMLPSSCLPPSALYVLASRVTRRPAAFRPAFFSHDALGSAVAHSY